LDNFLVGAVEYLAKRICEIESDEIDEYEYSERKRDVVRKCIYGVDLNSLAVDLAKLSLWLETLYSEKPLTFLHAHLKHGNSIIGENLEGVFDPQHSILETDAARRKLKRMIKAFLSFEDWEDDSSNTVKAKVEKYDSMQKRGSDKSQLQGILDHKIAEGFGLPKLEPWRDVKQKIGAESMDYYTSESGQSVNELSKKYHFFHWDLEFPQVFYDPSAKRKKNPGFDAVIGNPPYVKEMDNQKIFEPIKKSPYKIHHQGKMDYWYFFVQRAIDLLKIDGRLGFITNSYWTKSAGSSKLITRIRDNLVLKKCVDLDNIKVFKGVSGKHMIHIYRKGNSIENEQTEYIALEEKQFQGKILETNITQKPYQMLITDDLKLDFSPDIINFKNCITLGTLYDSSTGVQESTDKISRKALSNSNKKNFNVGQGIFVLSESELKSLKLNDNEKSIIKKYLDSTAIGRYKIQFGNEYLIYSDKEARDKIKNKKYPQIKKHLDNVSFFITSSNRPYGLHRTRERKYFENPKLICKGMFTYPAFSYDDENYFVGFSFSVIIQKNPNFSLKYLLGLLNSNLAKYWFNRFGKHRGKGVDIVVSTFRKFPVYDASSDEQNIIEDLVDNLLKLNKNMTNLSKEKHNVIDEKIKKIDNRLNEYILKLYKFTESEKKIFEKI